MKEGGGQIIKNGLRRRQTSNSQHIIASALCEAIFSQKQGIASTEKRRLAMTWFTLRIADVRHKDSVCSL